MKLEIESTNRLSKKLIELKALSIAHGENCLVKDLDLLLGPKTRLGLLGSNGSGKTSLLKVLAKQASNHTGQLYHADELRIVYFDQKRESLPQDVDLLHYLGDGADSVIFRERATSVAAYASRLLFPSEKMKLRIEHLSGGEQARLLIGKLLLQPADVLILDEPTNDLDIDSIEVLEEILSQFPGLVILVSHDRYFLSRLCDKYLGLENTESWAMYADLDQWLKQSLQNKPATTKGEGTEKPRTQQQLKNKPKLSYKDKRQMETLEQDLETAEAELAEAVAKLEDPEINSDQAKLSECSKIMEQKQARVDELYAFWEKVEAHMK